MLLTLSTTYEPATDLGFLLHKNPGPAQQVELPSGTAHVFYPEASAARCTAALLQVRWQVRQIPWLSVREAVLNAVVRRDWM